MKYPIKILLVLVLGFALMFLTSGLLSLPWIQEHWFRQVLVVLLVSTEGFHTYVIYIFLAKKSSRNQG